MTSPLKRIKRRKKKIKRTRIRKARAKVRKKRNKPIDGDYKEK
jgi:hypothetical protein